MVALAVISLCALSFSATHVYWYNATTAAYALTASPGPNLQGALTVHQGKMASGGIAQHTGANGSDFVFGSGLDDAQGRCAWFWSNDLCSSKGTALSAKYRAEFRDGYSGSAFCNSGPVAIHRGVVDFQGNLDFWGSADAVDNAANWKDDANLVGSFMGFNIMDPEIKASDTLNFTAPAGRPSEIDASVLDGQFLEVDCTPQVNWILKNTAAAGNPSGLSGQYAVVFLVTPGLGSTGKCNTYAAEDGVRSAIGSDNPWTQDGNTGHLVIVDSPSDPVVIVGIEKAASRAALNTVSLSQNTPNPFKPMTSIAYNTNGKSGALKIFDASGRMVYSRDVSGQGSVEWNAGRNVSGIYMYRLTVGSKIISKKMILMR